MQPMMVEPSHPFQRHQLDCGLSYPRGATMDHLGFVKTVDRLGKSIVVAVAKTIAY